GIGRRGQNTSFNPRGGEKRYLHDVLEGAALCDNTIDIKARDSAANLSCPPIAFLLEFCQVHATRGGNLLGQHGLDIDEIPFDSQYLGGARNQGLPPTRKSLVRVRKEISRRRRWSSQRVGARLRLELKEPAGV